VIPIIPNKASEHKPISALLLVGQSEEFAESEDRSDDLEHRVYLGLVRVLCVLPLNG
jgi:hypothetical protein